MLFLLFAESRAARAARSADLRGGLCGDDALPDARSPDAAAPTGLWEGLAAITRLSRSGCRTDDLIVRPFNGRLFARAAAPVARDAGAVAPAARRASATRATRRSRDALVRSGTRPGRGGREEIATPTSASSSSARSTSACSISIRDAIGMRPERTARRIARRHGRRQRAQRPAAKQTGTFYTPQSLAEFVVRRTLGPLVRGASADAILALRVVDPAMGSGAFLVAACRYLAARVRARARRRRTLRRGRTSTHDARADIRRLIAERCLAGVDVNPVAVQLARLSLWLDDARARQAAQLSRSPAARRQQPDRHLARRSLATAGAGARVGRHAAALRGGAARATRCARSRGRWRADARAATTPSRTCTRKSAIWSRLTGARSPLDPWRSGLQPLVRALVLAVDARRATTRRSAAAVRRRARRRHRRGAQIAIATLGARELEPLDLDRADASRAGSGCFTGRSSSPTCSTTPRSAARTRPDSTPSSAIRRGRC